MNIINDCSKVKKSDFFACKFPMGENAGLNHALNPVVKSIIFGSLNDVKQAIAAHGVMQHLDNDEIFTYSLDNIIYYDPNIIPSIYNSVRNTILWSAITIGREEILDEILKNNELTTALHNNKFYWRPINDKGEFLSNYIVTLYDHLKVTNENLSNKIFKTPPIMLSEPVRTLIATEKWNKPIINYCLNGSNDPSLAPASSKLNINNQTIVKEAFNYYSSIINIQFKEDCSKADISLGNRNAISNESNNNILGIEHTSNISKGGHQINHAEIVLLNHMDTKNYNLYNLKPMVIYHEIGHALGLLHPHITSSTTSPYTRDVTIMSDNQDHSKLPIYNNKYVLPSKPLPYDIEALSFLYGANPNLNIARTYISKNTPNPEFHTLHGNIELIDCLQAGIVDVLIDLNPMARINNIGNDFFWINKDVYIAKIKGSAGNNIIYSNGKGNEIDLSLANNGINQIYLKKEGIDKITLPRYLKNHISHSEIILKAESINKSIRGFHLGRDIIKVGDSKIDDLQIKKFIDTGIALLAGEVTQITIWSDNNHYF